MKKLAVFFITFIILVYTNIRPLTTLYYQIHKSFISEHRCPGNGIDKDCNELDYLNQELDKAKKLSDIVEELLSEDTEFISANLEMALNPFDSEAILKQNPPYILKYYNTIGLRIFQPPKFLSHSPLNNPLS